jgi:hypothetical protein
MYIEIPLKLIGPFKWRELFSQPEASEKGVYLWTTLYEGKCLVHYVGETGISFAKRFAEHTRNIISGLWDICDPVEFAKGNLKYIWEGSWKRDELREPTRAMKFLKKYRKLTKAAHDFFEVVQIFLIPMKDADEPKRKRVETLIAEALFNQSGITHDFQDEYSFSDSNRQSYTKFERKSTEDPIKVIFENSDQIVGLSQELREDVIEEKK